MNKDYSKILRYAKKIICINYLGGKCKKCGEKNVIKLTFHHRDESLKEEKISSILDRHIDKIIKELDKCDLLCSNCHTEIHFPNNRITSRNGVEVKKYYLELIGINGCETCGYDKCYSSLDFHHLNPTDKKYGISNLITDNLLEFKEKLELEINKCKVICKNCHVILHDEEFFETNKTLIYEKVKNLRRINMKLDREKIWELYINGMKQSEIAKYFNSSKGTISDIIKKLKNNS